MPRSFQDLSDHVPGKTPAQDPRQALGKERVPQEWQGQRIVEVPSSTGFYYGKGSTLRSENWRKDMVLIQGDG